MKMIPSEEKTAGLGKARNSLYKAGSRSQQRALRAAPKFLLTVISCSASRAETEPNMELCLRRGGKEDFLPKVYLLCFAAEPWLLDLGGALPGSTH